MFGRVVVTYVQGSPKGGGAQGLLGVTSTRLWPGPPIEIGGIAMRFIVDFYRYAILAVLALIIAGFAYFLLSLNNLTDISGAPLTLVALSGIGLIALLGVSLGFVATAISIHDRHIEIVEELRLLREHFEGRNGK